ncbi:hypothetical protein Patl1_09166 [Pistacia atlantica]|uniref:Uncharacterized protein n=1 Tax=Pistacia atlantica TaxID=434234 RepID=A0ACC1AEB8_9ROSI|nr:hypothetical protein Patl1_09166 [Pistacia atlantica]
MEGGGGGGDAASAMAPIAKWKSDFSRMFQYYLDRSTPHPMERWLGTLAAAAFILIQNLKPWMELHCLLKGQMSLGLLFADFLSSSSVERDSSLKESCNSCLYILLFDMQSWTAAVRYAITKAFCVAFLMTFFSIFDVPVFWPILLCYWIVLFVLTMKRQIMHMIKYKYVPFSFGKQVRDLNCYYSTFQGIPGKRPAAGSSGLPRD